MATKKVISISMDGDTVDEVDMACVVEGVENDGDAPSRSAFIEEAVEEKLEREEQAAAAESVKA